MDTKYSDDNIGTEKFTRENLMNVLNDVLG